jgi:hypothetical protein
MHPTLRETDLLELLPANEAGVRVGDVILFRPPGGRENVIHRVTAVAEDTFRTRGDNCDGEDPWSLTRSRIAGVVIAAWSGSRRRRVARGPLGILQGLAVRVRRALLKRGGFLIMPLYRALAEFDFSPLLPSRLRPRVVTWAAEGRTVRRILMGKTVVGHYDESGRGWRIRRPYGLFVSPAKIR